MVNGILSNAVLFLHDPPVREVSIAANSTVSGDHPAKQDDPQASLRAEMLGQIVAAQFELEKAVADLVQAGLNPSGLKSQLGLLTAFQQSISSAKPAELATLSSQIRNAAATAQNLADQSRQEVAAANSDVQNSAGQLAAARTTIGKVADDYYNRHTLDPYLQFSSERDEEEYRRRERANREEYEREMAKGTPEGTANAARVMKRQLRDAGDHGADASPEYAKMVSSLGDAEASLAPAPIKPSGAKAAEPVKATKDDLSDVMAALRDAGVNTETSPPAQTGHGLSSETRVVHTEVSSAGRAS